MTTATLAAIVACGSLALGCSRQDAPRPGDPDDGPGCADGSCDDDPWELTFSDEFDGPELDRTKWRTDYFGNPRAESFVLEGGTIKLRLTREMIEEPRVSHLDTRPSLAQQFGWFEIRAKLPAGDGFVPAFWLLPEDPAYERLVDEGGTRTNLLEAYEIDIFEIPTRNANGGVFSIHAGANTETDTARRRSQSFRALFRDIDVSRDFHTYAVNWGPTEVTWVVDGRVVGRNPMSPQAPFYLILDNQVANDGVWGNLDPDRVTFPKDLELDYVRVYQNAEYVSEGSR